MASTRDENEFGRSDAPFFAAALRPWATALRVPSAIHSGIEVVIPERADELLAACV